VDQKLKGAYETLRWELKYSSIPLKLFYPFWWLMGRDRGTEFPFYFPNERDLVNNALEVIFERLDNFVNIQEPERMKVDPNITFINRVKYMFYNFHYYSNDTMSNLLYGAELPARDYQRIKSIYNQYSLGLFAYNSLSGVLLVALNNYYFRSRKATLSTVLLATLTTYLLFAANYRISNKVSDNMLGFHVRRLGYSKLIHGYNSSYPRNIDYLNL
jgi:hypothetical protein